MRLAPLRPLPGCISALVWRTMDAMRADEENIADQIRRYLHDHPNAADTLEGIALWWLSGNTSNEWLTTVQRAIDRLVASGEVVRKTLPDGTVIVGRGKRDETR